MWDYDIGGWVIMMQYYVICMMNQCVICMMITMQEAMWDYEAGANVW
jgi:hypothetical protein